MLSRLSFNTSLSSRLITIIILMLGFISCDKEEPAQTLFKYAGNTTASFDYQTTDTSGVNRVLWDTMYADNAHVELDYIATTFIGKLFPKQSVVGPMDSAFTFYFIETEYKAFPDAYSSILFQRTDDSLFIHYLRDSGTTSNYVRQELMFRGVLEK